MNIKNINKDDKHLEFISAYNHVVAYSNKIGEVAVHDVSLKTGECHNGSYFKNTEAKAIKCEFIKRVTNALSYIV